jgi:transposase
LNAGVFDLTVHGLRVVLRLAEGRKGQPAAALFESRTLQSTPERGPRAGSDGAKRQRGSKGHRAVATSGHLLAWHVTAAHEPDRAPVEPLAEEGPAVTGDAVEVACVEQGSTGNQPAAAAAHGMRLEVVKLPEAKKGFVLLPRRWVVERSVAWVARCRRLARDYERWPATLAGFPLLAFVLLWLKRFVEMMVQSP